MQRWFAYGLQALERYWIQWHNRATLFVLLVSCILCEHNETKKMQIYVYMQWILQYLRLVLCFKTLVVYCNSS